MPRLPLNFSSNSQHPVRGVDDDASDIQINRGHNFFGEWNHCRFRGIDALHIQQITGPGVVNSFHVSNQLTAGIHNIQANQICMVKFIVGQMWKLVTPGTAPP